MLSEDNVSGRITDERYDKKEKWSRTEGNDIDIVFTVGFREQHTVRTSDAIAS